MPKTMSMTLPDVPDDDSHCHWQEVQWVQLAFNLYNV